MGEHSISWLRRCTSECLRRHDVLNAFGCRSMSEVEGRGLINQDRNLQGDPFTDGECLLAWNSAHHLAGLAPSVQESCRCRNILRY